MWGPPARGPCERVRKARGALHAGRQEVGDALGEGAAGAGRHETAEAAHAQDEVDGLGTEGEIAHLAAMVAMHGGRGLLTGGTDGLGLDRVRVDEQGRSKEGGLIHLKAGQRERSAGHRHAIPEPC